MKHYTEEQEAKYVEVLRGIQRSIPHHLLSNLVVEQKLTPTMEMVFKEAVTMESIPQEKRDQIQNLLDVGYVSKMTTAEDPKRAKAVDNYVKREINKAIKEGRLPPKSHIKYLPSIMKVRNEN